MTPFAIRVLQRLPLPFPGAMKYPLRSGRRGQSRVESAVALGVLIVAGIGAWMLYKDAIVETTKAMIGFFSSDEAR